MRSWWHSLAATFATSPYTAHSHRSIDPTNPQNASPVLTPLVTRRPTPRSSRARCPWRRGWRPRRTCWRRRTCQQRRREWIDQPHRRRTDPSKAHRLWRFPKIGAQRRPLRRLRRAWIPSRPPAPASTPPASDSAPVASLRPPVAATGARDTPRCARLRHSSRRPQSEQTPRSTDESSRSTGTRRAMDPSDGSLRGREYPDQKKPKELLLLPRAAGRATRTRRPRRRSTRLVHSAPRGRGERRCPRGRRHRRPPPPPRDVSFVVVLVVLFLIIAWTECDESVPALGVSRGEANVPANPEEPRGLFAENAKNASSLTSVPHPVAAGITRAICARGSPAHTNSHLPPTPPTLNAHSRRRRRRPSARSSSSSPSSPVFGFGRVFGRRPRRRARARRGRIAWLERRSRRGTRAPSRSKRRTGRPPRT